jgi:glutaredoxin
MLYMIQNEDLAAAEQEEIKASLGVPQIFLGNITRLNEDRFIRILWFSSNKL